MSLSRTYQNMGDLPREGRSNRGNKMSSVMEACGKKKEEGRAKKGGKENERGNVRKDRAVVKGKRRAKVSNKGKGKEVSKVEKKVKQTKKKTQEKKTPVKEATNKRKRPTEAEVMANLPKRSKVEYPKELKNASESRKEKWRLEQIAKTESV